MMKDVAKKDNEVTSQDIPHGIMKIVPAIKTLEVENLGCIEKEKLEFKPCINVIYGPHAIGKTTVINVIDNLLTGEPLRHNPNIFHEGKNMKEIVMKIEFLNKDIVKRVKSYESLALLQQNDFKQIIYLRSRGKRWTYPWFTWMLANNKNPKSWSTLLALREIVGRSFEGQTILLDDVLTGLDEEDRKKAFDILKTSKAQIIMTARCEDEIIEGANMIRLEHGGRKK